MPESFGNTLLVTGVAGFIGRHIARHFKSQGWNIIGVDLVSPENAPLGSLISYYPLNLHDEAFNNVLKNHSPQLCIHCAGRASVGLSMNDPATDFTDGPPLIFAVLDAIRRFSPECGFIFISSAAVYGNPNKLPVSENEQPAPISPYGFHKLQGEILCQEFYSVYNIPAASVRIFSAYGPGLRRQVIWDICQKLLVQESLNLHGTGSESRDFIHAIDIAKAIQAVADAAPLEGEVYNLSSGEEVTIRKLANLVLSALDSDIVPKFNGIVPEGTPLKWQADISKVSALGFRPSISLDKGIRTFAAWCQAELLNI